MKTSRSKHQRTPQKDNKEQAILDEACRLFAERGFDGTSIRDISDAVGISNAALYHYFSDKHALYAQICIAVTERQCDFISGRISPADGAAERLRAFMRAFADFFESHPHECVAASSSFHALRESSERERAIRSRDRYEQILRAIVTDGVKSGEFVRTDVTLFAHAVLSCLNWLHRWYSPAGRKRPREIIDFYADVLLGGVRPRTMATQIDLESAVS